MGQKKPEAVALNIAELEGFSRVSRERDDLMRRAQMLDQRLQEMAVSVVKQRGQDADANWSLDMAQGVIIPMPSPATEKPEETPKEPA